MTPDQSARLAVYLINSGSGHPCADTGLRMTQQNGKDVLTATDGVSSPAMTSLAPGQQQLVRIIVMQPGIQEQAGSSHVSREGY